MGLRGRNNTDVTLEIGIVVYPQSTPQDMQEHEYRMVDKDVGTKEERGALREDCKPTNPMEVGTGTTPVIGNKEL